MEPITIVYLVGAFGMLSGIPPALKLMGDDVGLDFDYVWAIPGLAALMYMLMMFDIGAVMVQDYHVSLPRYVDWALTTPLLVGYTAYVAGIARRGILGIVLVDFLMIAAGTAAALLTPPTQWVFFALAALCHLALLIGLYGPVRNSALGEPPSHRRLARLLLNYVGLLWIAYPLVWVFGPGLQLVSWQGIAVMITYLDVTAKVPFVYFIYRARRNFARVKRSSPEAETSREDASVASATA